MTFVPETRRISQGYDTNWTKSCTNLREAEFLWVKDLKIPWGSPWGGLANMTLYHFESLFIIQKRRLSL